LSPNNRFGDGDWLKREMGWGMDMVSEDGDGLGEGDGLGWRWIGRGRQDWEGKWVE